MRARLVRFPVRSCLLGAAVTAAILAQASPAAADALKISGTACTFSDGSVHIASNRFNWFRNDSTVTRTVICPVVKQILASPIRFFVRVTNDTTRAPINPASCFVVRRTGLSFTPHVADPNPLTLPDGTRDIEWKTAIAGGGSYTVQCDVPPGQAILWVQTAEP